jgi:CRP-like cAMP-binding protein
VIGSIFPLRESELFNTLSFEELGRVALICSESSVSEGTLLFTQGSDANKLYIVTQGLVALQMATRVPHATQSRRSTAAICGRGELVGWSSMVEPFQYTLTAMAWESCRLISIDAELLGNLVRADTATGFQVMQSLSTIMSRRIRQITVALVAERETMAARYNSINDN